MFYIKIEMSMVIKIVKITIKIIKTIIIPIKTSMLMNILMLNKVNTLMLIKVDIII